MWAPESSAWECSLHTFIHQPTCTSHSGSTPLLQWNPHVVPEWGDWLQYAASQTLPLRIRVSFGADEGVLCQDETSLRLVRLPVAATVSLLLLPLTSPWHGRGRPEALGTRNLSHREGPMIQEGAEGCSSGKFISSAMVSIHVHILM